MLTLAFILALASASAIPLSQDAAEADNGPAIIKPPAWVEPPQPSPDDYPKFASIVGLVGRVSLTCTATIEGHPRNCVPTSSSPEGLGFEAVAIKIVERGRLSPAQTADGPVEAKVSVTLPFSLSDATPLPPKWGGPEPTPAQMAAGEVFANWAITQPGYRDPINLGQEELTPRRQAALRPWIDELFGPSRSPKSLALAMARVLALRGMNQLPTSQPADWDVWQEQGRAAMRDLFDSKAAQQELRRRFCAEFDCGEQPPAA